MANATSEAGPQEPTQRGKRSAAAHEAGHLTASIATGAPTPSAVIARSDAGGWGGLATFTPDNSGVVPGEGPGRRALWRRTRAVSIAGGIGDFRDQHPGAAVEDFLAIYKSDLSTTWLSESDLEPFIEFDGKEDAVTGLDEAAHQAWALLEANREFHAWATTELLERESIAEDLAREKFEQLQAAG